MMLMGTSPLSIACVAGELWEDWLAPANMVSWALEGASHKPVEESSDVCCLVMFPEKLCE